MRRVRHREAADGHVGVPDGLDLLHAALGDDGIEGVEAIVELAHEIGRRESGGELGEAFKVGEENGDAVVVPRLGAAVPLQFDGGLGREDVVQQIVGAAFFLIQLGGALGDLLLELLVQHGVVDGNGDLAGKQREQVDPLPRERAGSQVVFQIEHTDAASAVQDGDAEDGDGPPFHDVGLGAAAFVRGGVGDDNRLPCPVDELRQRDG